MAAVLPFQPGPGETWRDSLLTKRVKNQETGAWYNAVIPNLSNVVTILRYHPRWAGVLAWNEFAERIVLRSAPPWEAAVRPTIAEAGTLRDSDTGRTVDWLARVEGLAVPPAVVEQAVPIVAEANAFHPVREYLRTLEWDGVERLPRWLTTLCGVRESSYSKAIGARWMISAVARVMQPGCQVDCTLILEGPQGIGKSSAFRALAPDPSLYSETGVTIGDKDSYQALHGVWVFVFDELDSLRRSEVTKTKNFLSSPKDHYRAPYGRTARDYPRQNVFGGTTNLDEYLVDRTGNRRILARPRVRAHRRRRHRSRPRPALGGGTCPVRARREVARRHPRAARPLRSRAGGPHASRPVAHHDRGVAGGPLLAQRRRWGAP